MTKYFIFFTLIYSGLNFAQVKNVNLLDHWTDTAIQSIHGSLAFNEVWGFIQNGKEYAVIGSAKGTHIFSISDDNKLIELQYIPGLYQDAIHRDYHDYNGYLYEVCDEGINTLRVYDLQYLPDSVHIVFDDDSEIIRCHNIFIDTSSALLYACGVTSFLTSDAVKVFSLAQPESPSLVYTYNWVNYVHDAYVRNDTAYFNCGGEGLRVVDFSNPSLPLPLGALTSYIEQGYNHSGWLSEDGNTYILCDETPASPFKVLDVSDLSNIEVLSIAKPPTFDGTLPHNVMFKDGLAYFSYYSDGLQIYDIRKPTKPQRIAYYDTFGNSDGIYDGAWGIYAYLPSGRLLVSDLTFGLFLFGYQPIPNNQNLDAEFLIFPNPGDETIYFYKDFPDNMTYNMEIFDATGKLVEILDGNSDYLKIDLRNFASGIYTYKVSSSRFTNIFIGKFIVQHRDK